MINNYSGKVFAIGDVHGCFNTLMALLKKVPEGVRIVFVGDLIDRGDKSRQVVEFVKDNGHDCVTGNHEIMPGEDFSNWYTHNGGFETTESYIGEDDLFRVHLNWFDTLPVYIEYPNVTNGKRHLVISHSSVSRVWKWNENKRKENYLMFRNTIVWNRQAPLDVRSIYNVFGHTPQKNKARVTKVYANVDTGCCFKQEGYGKLSGILFPDMIVIEQENID